MVNTGFFPAVSTSCALCCAVVNKCKASSHDGYNSLAERKDSQLVLRRLTP